MPTSFAIILALAGAVAIIVAIRWRRVLLMTLPFLVTLNGVPLGVGKYSIRADQFVACLLLMPLLAAAVAGTKRIRLDKTSWILMVLLAINIMSSALNSPVPTYSVLQCLNLAATWIIYVVLINYLDNPRELEEFLRYALCGAIVASIIGIAAFFLALSGMHVGGAEVSQSAAQDLTTAYGAYGTMVEPNILGSFSAAYLVLAVAMLVARTREHESLVSDALLRWVVALTAVSLVITFTRAAWLGAIVGFACLLALGDVNLRARFRSGRVALVVVSVVVVVGALLLLPGNVGTLFRFKVMNLINPASQTAIVRLFTYVLAFEHIVQHPAIGSGTFSFAALAAQGADFRQFENWRHLWIGNHLLLALHDTGVLGLGVWIALLATIIARPLRLLRTMASRSGEYAGRVLGLVAAIASLLIAFLSTTGFSLGYSWLIVGMLAAYCRVFEIQQGNSTTMETSEP
ncbi:MAG: O-antigen ligase family protein [bacterium]